MCRCVRRYGYPLQPLKAESFRPVEMDRFYQIDRKPLGRVIHRISAEKRMTDVFVDKIRAASFEMYLRANPHLSR